MFTLPIDMEFGWLAPLSLPSICRVRIDLHPTLGLICLMSERHDNPGQPVRWEPMDYFMAVDLMSACSWADDIFQTFAHRRAQLDPTKKRRVVGDRVKRKLHHLFDTTTHALWHKTITFRPQGGWGGGGQS